MEQLLLEPLTSWQSLWQMLCWPFQRRGRHILSWIAVAILIPYYLHTSLRTGVDGHITCDFAGQWMHGRAFFLNQCDKLYLVEPGKEWLTQGYSGPRLKEMIDSILFKGKTTPGEVEGALYPPTAGVFFSILAAYPPATAHALAVFTYLLMGVVCGWMISRMTGNRVQWGEAAVIILLFPNNFMGLMLGQNQLLTLTIITSGWYCFSRGWPLVGGLAWGLLAYKPVFAVALLLVPMVLPSMRMLMGMVAGGILFVALTLPYTEGLSPWLRWLQVGKNAEEIYRTDYNWVWMSRDLVGLPRRKMWDAESFDNQWRYNVGVWKPGARWYYTDKEGVTTFAPAAWLLWCDEFQQDKHQQVYLEYDEEGKPHSPFWPTFIGWSLLGTVAAGTLIVGRRSRLAAGWEASADAATGCRAAFLLTGGLLCVFHFMHYDIASFSLPALLALAEAPRRGKLYRAGIAGWLVLLGISSYAYHYGNGILNWPWDTYLMIVLWIWMGIITFRERPGSESSTP